MLSDTARGARCSAEQTDSPTRATVSEVVSVRVSGLSGIYLVKAGPMRHGRTAVAYLLAPMCVLSGCHGASEARSPGSPDQTWLSAATSDRPLARVVPGDAAPAPPSLNDSTRQEGLLGRWVLQQVQIGNHSPQLARPGQTSLSIRGGLLVANDACGQQIQAQVTVDGSTLQLADVVFGGGFPAASDHPCGDPEAVEFWNTSRTFEWEVDRSRLIVKSESMTLTYRVG